MKRAVRQRNFALPLGEVPKAGVAIPAIPATPATVPPLVIDPPAPIAAPVVRSCLDCISYMPPRCSDPLHGYIDDPAIPPCSGVDWLLRPASRRGHGRPFPSKCSWDEWGARLVTKCDAPEPTVDSTGCAHCGAVKP